MIFALHGALGLKQDWNPFLEKLKAPEALPEEFIYCADLYETDPVSIEDTARRLNEIAKSFSAPRLLLGYSLGGRLAMRMLVEAPELWTCAVFVGARVEICDPQEREQRRLWDASWKEKTLSLPWPEFLKAWEALPVFQGRALPENRRDLEKYRVRIAESFPAWSPANASVSLSDLLSVRKPILWVAGEHDLKYRALNRSIAQKYECFSDCVIDGIAHRVPMEAPQLFAQCILSFHKKHIQVSK